MSVSQRSREGAPAQKAVMMTRRHLSFVPLHASNFAALAVVATVLALGGIPALAHAEEAPAEAVVPEPAASEPEPAEPEPSQPEPLQPDVASPEGPASLVAHDDVITPASFDNPEPYPFEFLFFLTDHHHGSVLDYTKFVVALNHQDTLREAGFVFPVIDRGSGVTFIGWTGLGRADLTLDTTLSDMIWGYGWDAKWSGAGITSFSVSFEDEGDPTVAQRAGSVVPTAHYRAPNVSNVMTDYDITDLVTFEYCSPDLVVCSPDATIAGTYVVRGILRDKTAVTAVSGLFSLQHAYDIGDLALTVPASATVGQPAFAHLEPLDPYGNPFGENLFDGCHAFCGDLTLSSSEPSDVIDPLTGRMMFSTPGPRTIYLTLNLGEGGSWELQADIVVTQGPELARTGPSADAGLLAGGALALFGAGLMLRHAHGHGRRSRFRGIKLSNDPGTRET